MARAGTGTLAGKLLVDVANAVTPSFELVYPNSSLGEELQEAFLDARVVNTRNTSVQTNPSVVPPSSVFLSGDEEAAKTEAAGLPQDLGWSKDSIVDLGGISTAKGPEHYFLMFATIVQALRTPTFNIHLVH